MTAKILQFAPRKPFGDLSKSLILSYSGVLEVFDLSDQIKGHEALWVVRLAQNRAYNIRLGKVPGEYELDYIDAAVELKQNLGTYSANEVLTMIKISGMAAPARLGLK